MPKGDFHVSGWSTKSSFSVDVDKVRGQGGPEYPVLSIPIGISLRPMQEKEKIKTFSVLWLKSRLYIENMKIGEGISDPMIEYSWPHIAETNISIDIPLDLYRIECIEKKRRGDIHLKLSGTALIVEHPETIKAGPNEDQKSCRDVVEFKTGSFDISFTIPHSHWVDNVLPNLGYGKVKLIEVPVPEKTIPGIFQKALEELQQSQRYFMEGDYDEVVAHCRSAVQLIPEVLPVDFPDKEKPTFNDKVDGFLKEYLSIILADSKKKALANIIKAIWRVSSIPHHPSPPGYFNRADAEVIYHITTALLAYVGKLLKNLPERD
jgi:hypothetical protein